MEAHRIRNFITERSPAQVHPQAGSMSVRCRHTIIIDGTEYRCCRLRDHGGIHDGFCKHNQDGGLVRW